MVNEPKSREDILKVIVESYIDSLLTEYNNLFKFG